MVELTFTIRDWVVAAAAPTEMIQPAAQNIDSSILMDEMTMVTDLEMSGGSVHYIL